jgi:dual specificity protein kinase YAK1
LVGTSLLDALQQVEYQGLPLAMVQCILAQLLDQVAVICELGLCHCDIKPENVVFVNDRSTDLELIDFGSCCIVGDEKVQYVESRHYRAPEVALELGFDAKADVWSAGCVAAEMFVGLTLFPAISETHLIFLIDEMVGPFP